MDVNERSPSCSSSIIPRATAPVTHQIRNRMSPRAGMKDKYLAPVRNRIPIPELSNPLPSDYTHCRDLWRQ
jgi:hypothetical protein